MQFRLYFFQLILFYSIITSLFISRTIIISTVCEGELKKLLPVNKSLCTLGTYFGCYYVCIWCSREGCCSEIGKTFPPYLRLFSTRDSYDRVRASVRALKIKPLNQTQRRNRVSVFSRRLADVINKDIASVRLLHSVVFVSHKGFTPRIL